MRQFFASRDSKTAVNDPSDFRKPTGRAARFLFSYLLGIFSCGPLATSSSGLEPPVEPPKSITGILADRCDELNVWGGPHYFSKGGEVDSNSRGKTMGLEIRCSTGFDRLSLGVGAEFMEARKTQNLPSGAQRNQNTPVLGVYLGPRFGIYRHRGGWGNDWDIYGAGYFGYYSLQNAKLTQTDKAGQITLDGNALGADAGLGVTYTIRGKQEVLKRPITKRIQFSPGPNGDIKVVEWTETITSTEAINDLQKREMSISTQAEKNPNNEQVAMPEKGKKEGGTLSYSDTLGPEQFSISLEILHRFLGFSSVSQTGKGDFEKLVPSSVDAPDRLDFDGLTLLLSVGFPFGKK